MFDEVLDIHKKNIGVLKLATTESVHNNQDLAKMYTPGVAELSLMIEKNHNLARELTISGKLVAIITDGSAVLGLGNVGAQAGLPIVEGKALLYKDLAEVDAIPLAIEQRSVNEIVQTIGNLQSSFAGIHLEDIAAPKCFEIEEKLQEKLSIPVYHDDQEGTAIIVLAALINAAKLKNKSLSDLHIVINGIGASGVATARLLIAAGITNLTLIDKQGVLKKKDQTLNKYQRELLNHINKTKIEASTLDDAIAGQDVFIGLSVGNILTSEMIKKMGNNPIIFALANPLPEIEPDIAKEAGVNLIATGSSKFSNQVNNILVFPGLFKGLLISKANKVDVSLQYEIAKSIAAMVKNPTPEKFIPNVFDRGVVDAVSQTVITYVQKIKEKEEMPYVNKIK
ncbi:NAD(P)-dependent malic enzyme [Enterococcus sp. DIV0086]|uniref:NAD(P)-dependent malic enzyme n=1 Tax=Enterococcus sp. DIV0086 TaxID=2774655 RepID=UPI003D278EE2